MRARYDRLLAGMRGVETPERCAVARHVYHIYAVRTPERDALQRASRPWGSRPGIHYPIPVHLQPAYADLGYRTGDFPESEAAANEVLSLPMFPEMTPAQVDEVVAAAVRQEAMSCASRRRAASSGPSTAVGSPARSRLRDRPGRACCSRTTATTGSSSSTGASQRATATWTR